MSVELCLKLHAQGGVDPPIRMRRVYELHVAVKPVFRRTPT